MTWKEMHIAFELAVNQLSATTDRGFQQEEIDVYLNQAMDVLINATIKGDRSKLIESINTSSIALGEINGLLRTRNFPIEKEGMQHKVVLPSSFYSYVSGVTGITCINPVNRYNKTVKTANVALPPISGNVYQKFKIVVNYNIGVDTHIETFNFIDYPLIKSADKFELINLIKDIKTDKFNISWEDDNDTYENNRIRIWAIDEQNVTINFVSMFSQGNLIIGDTTYTEKVKSYTTAIPARELKATFVGAEDFALLAERSTYANSNNLIICTIVNNSILVGNSRNCVPIKMTLTYYQFPTKISSIFDKNLRVSTNNAVNRKVGDKIARLAAYIATANIQGDIEKNLLISN